METKKVIEQETVKGIEVHKLECLTVVYQFGKAPIDIEESKATEVAKAIDPEYQKVIDQNAKLVEALRDVELCLESQLYNDEISRGVLSSLLQRVKALQNTKNIEG